MHVALDADDFRFLEEGMVRFVGIRFLAGALSLQLHRKSQTNSHDAGDNNVAA